MSSRKMSAEVTDIHRRASKPGRGGKDLIVNMSLLAISLIISIFIAEISLRMTWSNYWKDRGRMIYFREQTPNDNRRYLRDKKVVKEGGYVTIQADGDGFLMPNFIKKDKEGLITIAFLGGSTTECFWVTDTKRFPYLAGKKLADDLGVSVKVLNAGCAANNTQNSLNVLFNKVINYNPDIVVMMHAVNDAGVLMNNVGYENDMIKNTAPSLFDYLSIKSYLVGFLRHIRARYIVNKLRVVIALDNISDTDKNPYYDAKMNSETLRKPLEQYTTRLKIFVDMVRDMGGAPVLMTQPYYKKIDKDLSESEKRTFLSGINYMDAFNNKIREVADLKKCDLIDLEKELPKQRSNFYDWIHYSDSGSEKVADIVYRHIKDIAASRIASRDNKSL